MWYNSLSTYDTGALEVVESVKAILEWIGEDPGSAIANVTWGIEKCKSGAQHDDSSCGPFTAANATAIAQGIPVPKHVTGVRYQMASVMLNSARDLPIDWTSFKNVLTANGPVSNSPEEKSEVKPTPKSMGDTEGQEDIEDNDANADVGEGFGMPAL